MTNTIQHIVIGLIDSTPENPSTYVQVTRKRFDTWDDAVKYAEGVAPSRHPCIVNVDGVETDKDGYPIYKP